MGAVAVAWAGLAWVGAPHLLEHLSLFRVRQVELVGVKYLAPEAVLTALRLPADASVFTDRRLLADRVKGLNGVAGVSVVRRLPGTLEVIVNEVEPTALVPGPRGVLVPVDGEGRALPFDPQRTGLDLPIVRRPDSVVVGVLAQVQAVDPGLFDGITGAESLPHGDVLLDWGSRRVLFSPGADADAIRAVTAVATDLAATGHAYTELDARFAGQVVVRSRSSRLDAGRGGRERERRKGRGRGRGQGREAGA